MPDINEMLLRVYYQECFRNISGILKDFTFDYSLIKGDILSIQAYNKPGQRVYSDIDILVSVEHLREIRFIMKSHGFECNECDRSEHILLISGSHQIHPYTLKLPQPWTSLIVDINFDIFWGEYEGKHVNIEEFLSDTIEMDIYGVKIKTLPPIKSMVQLILHHYKDMNSIFLLSTRKSIKYDMFKDIYFLLKNNLDTITLDKLYTISTEYDIINYVYYVLYYTGQIFKDKILKQYIDAFKTSEGEALLNCYGLCNKERKQWKCDFKTRLKSENLYELIKNDLNEKDKENIAINKHIFWGESE